MSAILGAMAAPVRSYITGLLQTYLSTYIKDIQLEGASRISGVRCRPAGSAPACSTPTHTRRVPPPAPRPTPPPAPAGMGLLGSDIVLNNLELRLEALQELVPTPLTFEFTRGYVRVS